MINLRIVALLGFMALGLTIAGLTAQVGKYHKLDDAHRACVQSIGPKARPDQDPAKLCAPAIASAWSTAARANACDTALTAKPEGLFGIKASCSLPVKTVLAERDAARTNLTNVQAALDEERASQGAALRRAEAAGKAQAERTARAEAARAAAPRDPDGLSVCDAGCLRARAGITTRP